MTTFSPKISTCFKVDEFLNMPLEIIEERIVTSTKLFVPEKAPSPISVTVLAISKEVIPVL